MKSLPREKLIQEKLKSQIKNWQEEFPNIHNFNEIKELTLQYLVDLFESEFNNFVGCFQIKQYKILLQNYVYFLHQPNGSFSFQDFSHYSLCVPLRGQVSLFQKQSSPMLLQQRALIEQIHQTQEKITQQGPNVEFRISIQNLIKQLQTFKIVQEESPFLTADAQKKPNFSQLFDNEMVFQFQKHTQFNEFNHWVHPSIKNLVLQLAEFIQGPELQKFQYQNFPSLKLESIIQSQHSTQFEQPAEGEYFEAGNNQADIDYEDGNAFFLFEQESVVLFVDLKSFFENYLPILHNKYDFTQNFFQFHDGCEFGSIEDKIKQKSKFRSSINGPIVKENSEIIYNEGHEFSGIFIIQSGQTHLMKVVQPLSGDTGEWKPIFEMKNLDIINPEFFTNEKQTIYTPVSVDQTIIYYLEIPLTNPDTIFIKYLRSYSQSFHSQLQSIQKSLSYRIFQQIHFQQNHYTLQNPTSLDNYTPISNNNQSEKNPNSQTDYELLQHEVSGVSSDAYIQTLPATHNQGFGVPSGYNLKFRGSALKNDNNQITARIRSKSSIKNTNSRPSTAGAQYNQFTDSIIIQQYLSKKDSFDLKDFDNKETHTGENEIQNFSILTNILNNTQPGETPHDLENHIDKNYARQEAVNSLLDPKYDHKEKGKGIQTIQTRLRTESASTHIKSNENQYNQNGPEYLSNKYSIKTTSTHPHSFQKIFNISNASKQKEGSQIRHSLNLKNSNSIQKTSTNENYQLHIRGTNQIYYSIPFNQMSFNSQQGNTQIFSNETINEQIQKEDFLNNTLLHSSLNSSNYHIQNSTNFGQSALAITNSTNRQHQQPLFSASNMIPQESSKVGQKIIINQQKNSSTGTVTRENLSFVNTLKLDLNDQQIKSNNRSLFQANLPKRDNQLQKDHQQDTQVSSNQSQQNDISSYGALFMNQNKSINKRRDDRSPNNEDNSFNLFEDCKLNVFLNNTSAREDFNRPEIRSKTQISNQSPIMQHEKNFYTDSELKRDDLINQTNFGQFINPTSASRNFGNREQRSISQNDSSKGKSIQITQNYQLKQNTLYMKQIRLDYAAGIPKFMRRDFSGIQFDDSPLRK